MERREVPLEIMRYSIFCIKINYGGWARISGKISLEIIIGLKAILCYAAPLEEPSLAKQHRVQ